MFDTPSIYVECDECDASDRFELSPAGRSGWSEAGVAEKMAQEEWTTAEDDANFHRCPSCSRKHAAAGGAEP